MAAEPQSALKKLHIPSGASYERNHMVQQLVLDIQKLEEYQCPSP